MSFHYTNKYLSFAALICIVAILLSGCASSVGTEPISGILSDEDEKLFDAAMKKIAKEDYEAAVTLLVDLTNYNQRNPVPFINLAIAYKKLDKFENAEQSLKKAMEIEPHNPVANNEYGLLLRRLGRFGEARVVYENILTEYPYFAMASKNLGVLCDIYIRDYPCALKAYQTYSSLFPGEDVQIWISDLEYRIKHQSE